MVLPCCLIPRTLLVAAAFCLSVLSPNLYAAQAQALSRSAAYFVDCSAAGNGDGTMQNPWNALAAAQAHPFVAGDHIALRRGTVCHGTFAPQGSGAAGRVIRLTAYGEGVRPRIVAATSDRQALLLFNQRYWQVDSLDIAGGNTYGVFVSGDRGVIQHIALRNLWVHDVYGSEMKNKDNGLVVIGPSGQDAVFEDIRIEGVDAAHTRMWAGILVGGGPFPYPDDAPLNRRVEIRNSTASDVFGDGIVLFRVQDGLIASSAAWQTGMQPTETIGTPNAIWTWTCTHCSVEDSEAFLTDSPGVDGGAYDIDWNDHDNTVLRNFAHDTQGYCVAVFGAGYKTTNSRVAENLCIDNGLSPRLGALQGAIYIRTWNSGIIHGLTVERNRIEWNPHIPSAAAIVSDATAESSAPLLANNTIVSTTPWIYRIDGPIAGAANAIQFDGEPLFTVAGKQAQTLRELQAAGMEKGSSSERKSQSAPGYTSLRLDSVIDSALDADGLLMPEVRGQLVVLRSLACQYSPQRLQVVVHLAADAANDAVRNAVNDLDAVCPGAIRFDYAAVHAANNSTRLLSPDGAALHVWHGYQNAAELGGAVRANLGAPDFLPLQRAIHMGDKR
jgi:hypothetical protein